MQTDLIFLLILLAILFRLHAGVSAAQSHILLGRHQPRYFHTDRSGKVSKQHFVRLSPPNSKGVNTAAILHSRQACV